MKAHLCALLVGIPVALFIDGSDTHCSGFKKIIHVMADSAALDHLMLLAVQLEDEKSCNAAYVSTLLKDDTTEYGIDRSQVVVATDNTAVTPKGVRLAGLAHLPCVAHVIDLILGGIADALGFRDLFGWRASSFLDRPHVARTWRERGSTSLVAAVSRAERQDEVPQ